jgi:flagellar basal-body rod modification protein FlgD
MSLTIPPSLPVTGGTPSQAADLSRQSIGTDYNNFLKLLVAQVQNQDPLEPMDSTTFVSQLAQLSQVEQAIQTNKNLESISGRMDSVSAFADLGLLGRTVRVTGDKTELRDGAAAFSYTPAAPAAQVELELIAPDGSVAHRIWQNNRPAGEPVELTWNGITSSGTSAQDGSYQIRARAFAQDGTPVAVSTTGSATVSEVRFLDGVATLLLSTGAMIPSDQVRSVL